MTCTAKRREVHFVGCFPVHVLHSIVYLKTEKEKKKFAKGGHLNM